jgi:hypothetical protein
MFPISPSLTLSQGGTGEKRRRNPGWLEEETRGRGGRRRRVEEGEVKGEA